MSLFVENENIEFPLPAYQSFQLNLQHFILYGRKESQFDTLLIHLNFSDEILDTFQPDIDIEEFYSKSENHGASYEVQVCLLDGCGNVINKVFNFRENMEAEDNETWKKVTHTFKDYGVGVRYIKFYHGGMAEDMEEGWFGARMTGASVIIKYPELKKTESTLKCNCNTKHKITLNLS